MREYWRKAVIENCPYNNDQELVFKDEAAALQVASLLMKEGYAIMLTKEEGLTIVSFAFAVDFDSGSDEPDRSTMVFCSKEYFNDYHQAILEEDKNMEGDY